MSLNFLGKCRSEIGTKKSKNVLGVGNKGRRGGGIKGGGGWGGEQFSLVHVIRLLCKRRLGN